LLDKEKSDAFGNSLYLAPPGALPALLVKALDEVITTTINCTWMIDDLLQVNNFKGFGFTGNANFLLIN